MRLRYPAGIRQHLFAAPVDRGLDPGQPDWTTEELAIAMRDADGTDLAEGRRRIRRIFPHWLDERRSAR